MVTDSQPLIDSLESTKPVEDKLVRPLVKFLKQALDARWINTIRWCDTKVCLADILTKPGAPLTRTVLEIMKTNKMIDLSVSVKKSVGGRCDYF